MIKKILIYALLLIFLAIPVSATTYYIDHTAGDDSNNGTAKETAWAHCPMMVQDFTGSYSHSAGDIFIFKGGETWTCTVNTEPLMYIYSSGTEGNIDIYTVDETWYTGGAYTAPIFDGNDNLTNSRGLIEIISKEYIKINGLKFVNVGTSGSYTSGRTIKMQTSSYIEISYNTFQPYCHHAINFDMSSGTYNDIKIHHNEIYDVTNYIEFNVAGGTLNGLHIYNNTFRDPYSMVVGGDHADGIHLFSYVGAEAGTGTISDLKIYDNYWKGDWGSADDSACTTGMLFMEFFGSADAAPLIYNNLFTYEINAGSTPPCYDFRAIIQLSGSGIDGAKVLNNTIVGRDVSTDQYAGIDVDSAENITIENNIISNIAYPIRILGVPTVTSINYNVIDEVAGTYPGKIEAVGKTWAQWQALGYEANGYNEAPNFVDGVYPYDLTLLATSPGVESGTDQSGDFTTDYAGITRPVGAEWEIGAYEFDPEGAATGTIIPGGCQESEIVTGSKTVVATISGDELVETFGSDNAITTAFIQGFDSAQAEGGGWNAKVRDIALTHAAVTRTSATVATVILPAVADYQITANETITLTIPATSVVGEVEIVCTPTFQISAEQIGAESIGSVYDATGPAAVRDATGPSVN